MAGGGGCGSGVHEKRGAAQSASPLIDNGLGKLVPAPG
ncbi:hypothetical protein AZ15_0111 [Bordetella bronchiseptica A1-7]|nr:hypothetical protein AZ15_0111 [Bordetella bronchiseptica A1-7]KDB96434.1 hypothetical protein AZ23_0205 [Bordetella bronchiseptica E010]KDC05084.1 hypothetical protein AZ24_0130 [Bordetella bronchiseptica E013]